jgi:hypothetical protein
MAASLGVGQVGNAGSPSRPAELTASSVVSVSASEVVLDRVANDGPRISAKGRWRNSTGVAQFWSSRSYRRSRWQPASTAEIEQLKTSRRTRLPRVWRAVTRRPQPDHQSRGDLGRISVR